MTTNKPIKLYLLTGFLGSGKTTFLQRLINNRGNEKIGIIMNEFGKISIDGVMLQRNGIDVLSINNGSIFCSCLKTSFINGLIEYSQLPIDVLFVESSGMSDPSNIKNILDNVVGKIKGNSFDYRGAVCIVDAVHFLDQADLIVAIEKQVVAGNYIIINKCDLADQETLSQVEERIRELNPYAEIIRALYCDWDFQYPELNRSRPEFSGEEESSNTPCSRPESYTIEMEGSFEKEKFLDFILSLKDSFYRIKGFVRLKSGFHHVDVVGDQIAIQPAEITQDLSQLVLISNRGLPSLQALYENWDKRFTEKMDIS